MKVEGDDQHRDELAWQRATRHATVMAIAVIGVGLILGWRSLCTTPTAVAATQAGIPTYQVKVVRSLPHDPTSYTQGLTFDDEGRLFEGTGRLGESKLRELDPKTGQVLRSQDLDSNLFGEGIAVWGSKIVQLTWKSGVGLIYDKEATGSAKFPETGRFSYAGEGWGLTHDGDRLILSDGSYRLRWLSPKTLQVVETLDVIAGRSYVSNLNELEYINGRIWSNIYEEDLLVIIDPESGQVIAQVDLSSLRDELTPEWQRRMGRDPINYVLNGIAHDRTTNSYYVTGKYWPKLFQIKLVRAK